MNEAEIKKLIKKYELFLFPIGIGIVSLFLLFQIIIPQINDIPENRQKNGIKQEQVTRLQEGLSALQRMNDTSLEEDFSVSTTALPESKNVIAIFLAINSIATRSNVIPESFSLKVGDVYSNADKKKKETTDTTSTVGVPSLTVALVASADNYTDIINFSENLYNVLPLAEVKNVDFSDGNANFEINFFYKPYDLSQFSPNTPLHALTAQEQKTLQIIEAWK